MLPLCINKRTGLISPAVYLPSPHRDQRPLGAAIKLVVVHGISLPPGQFDTGAVEAFFMGHLNPSAHPYFATIQHLRVSAHLFIKRNGALIQFVPLHERAWHAGESAFQGESRCNDFSIGIELEGTDELPYEPIQYQQLTAVVQCLRQVYPQIAEGHIVGHSDIAPGRKTDPGPSFEWKKWRDQLHGSLESL